MTSPDISGSMMLATRTSQLLHTIQTGNVIIDTILASLVLSSQETIKKVLSMIASYITIFVNNMWANMGIWYTQSHLKITKTTAIKYITDAREINTLFDHVLWYINSQTELTDFEYTTLETTKNNTTLTQQIPRERKAFVMYRDYKISYVISSAMITIYGGDREHQRENHIITLSVDIPRDYKGDFYNEFGNMCITKHQDFNQKKNWEQCIYRNTKGEWKSQVSKNSRRLCTVILKKGEMESLSADLNDFLANEEWYTNREVSYTRRYLFSGIPGAGKSSCIKAISGHTKRHVYYLILSEIGSDAELFKLMEAIPHHQSVVVLEDIDCATDIVHARQKDEEKTDEEKVSRSAEEEATRTREKSSREDKKSTLTLSGILNAIDGGMIQTHGQILIMTTNHPEKLDPALLRPGRIDRHMEFSHCDAGQIESLFVNFFDNPPPLPHPKEYKKVSPAEIVQIFLSNRLNPEKAWADVVAKYSSPVEDISE